MRRLQLITDDIQSSLVRKEAEWVLPSPESVTDDTNFKAATEYSAEKSHKDLIGRRMGTAQRHKIFHA
jgi:hypothetical protein